MTAGDVFGVVASRYVALMSYDEVQSTRVEGKLYVRGPRLRRHSPESGSSASLFEPLVRF